MMKTKDHGYAEAFKAHLQEKIQTLLDEFAEGKISREQFHALYERYSGRLEIVDHAMLSGNPDAVAIAETGPTTLQIKEETSGKALGVVIYHNARGTLIETLGTFSVPVDKVIPIMLDYVRKAQENSEIEAQVNQLSDKQWLLLAAGKHTTVVTLFRNEPARQQMRDIERLQRDFENANHTALEQDQVDPSKLAYPFIVFVQKKLGKP